MLSHLSIRDIVLIERLDIDFSPGLSVLTGETGAGKSILLDALSLALGARGDAALVRHGAEQGQVTAVFEVPLDHGVHDILARNAIASDGEVILRRVQSADGRTRVFVNDQPSSVALMREIARALVEIHGQHDERALVDAAAHRRLLDAFGGHLDRVGLLEEAWTRWRSLERELIGQRARIEAAAREADYLRASVEELEALDPMPGEETELAERRAGMMRAQKIATEIGDAHGILCGPDSPASHLSSLLRRLERKSAEAPGLLEDVLEALDQALVALDTAQAGIEAAIGRAEFDPSSLERAEERLFALRAAARKHKVPVDELARLRDDMAAELADLDAGHGRLLDLEKEMLAARQVYDLRAVELSQLRSDSALALTRAVMAELPALRLERAEFMVALTSEPENRTIEGIDEVEFRVRTNPGSRPGQLARVASGGELSRFLLALKVSLADRGSAPTLVFDEIDTGVGGAIADAIGKRLGQLANKVQVLSVTHAPQVAARAENHFLISKTAGDGHAETRVQVLVREARQEEIARMLAGATITEEARAAAGRLLRETAQAL